MKKKWATAALSAVLVIGAAAGAWAGAKQIIRIEDGKRTETNLEGGTNGKLVEILPDNQTAAETEEENLENTRWEAVKLWGIITGAEEGSFSLNNQSLESVQEEVIVHLDPEKTLVLDSVTGYPAEEGSLQAGQLVYAYVGPAMTMSLPPQATAEIVFVNVLQDAAAPEYLMTAGSLEDDGMGGFVLNSKTGEKISVPADCTIIPYLTRQMVRLEDIVEGRKCIVWKDAEGKAEKIVLFNE